MIWDQEEEKAEERKRVKVKMSYIRLFDLPALKSERSLNRKLIFVSIETEFAGHSLY